MSSEEIDKLGKESFEEFKKLIGYKTHRILCEDFTVQEAIDYLKLAKKDIVEGNVDEDENCLMIGKRLRELIDLIMWLDNTTTRGDYNECKTNSKNSL